MRGSLSKDQQPPSPSSAQDSYRRLHDLNRCAITEHLGGKSAVQGQETPAIHPSKQCACVGYALLRRVTLKALPVALGYVMVHRGKLEKRLGDALSFDAKDGHNTHAAIQTTLWIHTLVKVRYELLPRLMRRRPLQWEQLQKKRQCMRK